MIAEDSRIDGNISFTDGLRVDGEVVGNICVKSDLASILVISETASVMGEVHVNHIIMNGMLNGPVPACVVLALQPKARIQGDVHYTSVEMHQGAIMADQMHHAVVQAGESPH